MGLPALEAPSPSHWTAGEFSTFYYFMVAICCFLFKESLAFCKLMKMFVFPISLGCFTFSDLQAIELVFVYVVR